MIVYVRRLKDKNVMSMENVCNDVYVCFSESPNSPSSTPVPNRPDSAYIVLGVVCAVCLLIIVMFGVLCLRNGSYLK